jgi:hypothetical protein
MQLYKCLVGSKDSPGSWLKSQCSPGSRRHFTNQFERLEKLYHKVKIKNKQNVVWRKEGMMLFDLFTEPKDGEFFDMEFYENQKNGPRDQEISDELTREYVEILEETAEENLKKTAKIMRESGKELFEKVSNEDPNNSPEKDCDESDTTFGLDHQEISEVSKQLDFSNSGGRTRRTRFEIDSCLAKPGEHEPETHSYSRKSVNRNKKCGECDQLLPQFRKSIHTQTPGVNHWQQDSDVKDFNPWPQLKLRTPKTGKRYKSSKCFVPEVIETIVDIHTGNRVGIKSSIDIFRKVAKLFGNFVCKFNGDLFFVLKRLVQMSEKAVHKFQPL